MLQKRKLIFGAYCLLVASLSIGWYPENKNKNVKQSIISVRENADWLATLVENNQFCSQGIRETTETERLVSSQQDERARRAVKTVIRYRVNLDTSSRRILERIVEAEAGDQDVAGRQMVANVILNRLQSSRFPNTVAGVVFAHRQFSPVSNGSYYRVTVSNTTKRAVEKALKEKDNTKGALYFMYRAGSDAGNISWFDRELTKLFAYGCHEFFR